MPAHRKPEGQRLRRNLPTVSAFLPADGYQGPIPSWPLEEQSEYEAVKWDWVWRTPAAAEWIRMDIAPVVARYIRIAAQAEQFGSKVSMAESNVKSEARQLEKVLGLNPDALRLLQWEVERDQPTIASVEPIGRRTRPRAADAGESA